LDDGRLGNAKACVQFTQKCRSIQMPNPLHHERCMMHAIGPRGCEAFACSTAGHDRLGKTVLVRAAMLTLCSGAALILNTGDMSPAIGPVLSSPPRRSQFAPGSPSIVGPAQERQRRVAGRYRRACGWPFPRRRVAGRYRRTCGWPAPHRQPYELTSPHCAPVQGPEHLVASATSHPLGRRDPTRGWSGASRGRARSVDGRGNGGD
jgi:hypothetical protein